MSMLCDLPTPNTFFGGWWVGEWCVVVVLRVSTATVLLLVTSSTILVSSTSCVSVAWNLHNTDSDSMFHYFHYLSYLYICRNIRSQWHICVSPSLVFSIWSHSPSHHVEVLSVAFDVDYITRVSVFGIDRLILQLTVPWGCWQIGVFSENSKARQVAYVDRENINKR